MISKWKWVLLQFTRRLWIRAAVLSLAGVIAALIAVPLEPLIPEELAERVGARSVDQILNILASSLLAVTTFSLTVMVSAYSAATNNVTPRANKLLMEDTTTQNVLATFIGSFLFSLVGIVALSAGAFGDEGRLILFAATIGIIVIIVVTLLRWIEHLSVLGRVGETTDRVEKAARSALGQRIENPYLGGRRLAHSSAAMQEGAAAIYTDVTGYVQHLDMERLSDFAEEKEGEIYLGASPGTFVHPARPLLWLRGCEVGEEEEDNLRGAFSLADARSFVQDPRFGISVLAEIASRALSPAVNDPGTAIDVLGRAVRMLRPWGDALNRDSEPELRWPRVWVPPITSGELFDDLFAPIARDGASIMEVQIRLQKALLALAHTGDDDFREAVRRHSTLALHRAQAALLLDVEMEVLRTLAEEVERTCRAKAISTPGSGT